MVSPVTTLGCGGIGTCADGVVLVGGGELPGSVGLLGEVPVGVVDQVVVFGADGDEVVEVGVAAGFPWSDVVYFAHVEVAVAPPDDAGVIQTT